MRLGLTFLLVISMMLRVPCVAVCVDGAVVSAPNRVDKLDLTGIQDTVLGAFYRDMGMQRAEALPRVVKALESGALDAGKSRAQIVTYWRSYALYYSSIYYMQTKQPEKAAATVQEGIELLEALGQKGSDEYAMLARLQGVGLAFAGPKAPQVAQLMVANGAKAIELDAENVRAYVVAAINDYFTPKAFGGRQKVKAYLTKALALPAQRVESAFMPSWGREEAFEYLLRYKLEEEKGEGAAALYERAIQEFPNSYMIRSLAPQVTK